MADSLHVLCAPRIDRKGREGVASDATKANSSAVVLPCAAVGGWPRVAAPGGVAAAPCRPCTAATATSSRRDCSKKKTLV